MIPDNNYNCCTEIMMGADVRLLGERLQLAMSWLREALPVVNRVWLAVHQAVEGRKYWRDLVLEG